MPLDELTLEPYKTYSAKLNNPTIQAKQGKKSADGSCKRHFVSRLLITLLYSCVSFILSSIEMRLRRRFNWRVYVDARRKGNNERDRWTNDRTKIVVMRTNTKYEKERGPRQRNGKTRSKYNTLNYLLVQLRWSDGKNMKKSSNKCEQPLNNR